MDELKKIEIPVIEELARFQEYFATSLRSSTRYLQNAIDTVLQSNGKHIRPLLVLLTGKACGKCSDNTINSAVLLEMLHTASLIHDDVVDETKQRRGLPSLNAVYDNRVAVLVGDYILSAALIRAIHSGNLRVMHIISNIGKDLAEGEIKQLENVEETILDEDSYLEVIRKKTASLLSACTEMGAISADASEETVILFRDFGRLMGFCFQIKDDLFDYDRQACIGKPTGNDIREGKVTLPLLYALRTAEGEDAKKAHQIIENKNFTDTNIDFLIQFAIQNGGITYGEKKMKEYYTKAIELLHQLPESDARKSLFLLADYVINREK